MTLRSREDASDAGFAAEFNAVHVGGTAQVSIDLLLFEKRFAEGVLTRSFTRMP